jgi:hypothetical protein
MMAESFHFNGTTQKLLHQPMSMLVRGTGEKSGSGNYCLYKKCPGLNNTKKTTRVYRTIYQCEECTVEKKAPFWLCHTTKKVNGKDTVVSCHLKYHAEKAFLTGLGLLSR